MTDANVVARLDALLADFGGRATGLWRVEGDALRLVAFRAAADMPSPVREGFAAATAVVPLDRVELSIARAAREGVTVVARAAELPPEAGSGYWLRAFGAARSVAVPVAGGVLSIALPAARDHLGDDAVADRVRLAAEGLD